MPSYQDAVSKRYIKSIPSEGLIPDVRSAPVVMVDDARTSTVARNHTPYLMIGSNSLSQSIYAANKQDPSNPQVVASIRGGIRNAICIDSPYSFRCGAFLP